MRASAFELRPAIWYVLIHLFICPQSSSHGGDQELVARMKSLEVENHTLHKGVLEREREKDGRGEGGMRFVFFSPVLLVTKYLSPVAMVLFVSGGDHERSPAEAGGQSGRTGKEPRANSCLLRQGRRPAVK